jgi:hypothetical protein
VHQLDIDDYVHFENRYLSYRELVLHLLASDVYVVALPQSQADR